MNNHSPNNGGPTDMSRTAMPPPGTIVAAASLPPASTAPGGYQVSAVVSTYEKKESYT